MFWCISCFLRRRERFLDEEYDAMQDGYDLSYNDIRPQITSVLSLMIIKNLNPTKYKTSSKISVLLLKFLMCAVVTSISAINHNASPLLSGKRKAPSALYVRLAPGQKVCYHLPNSI